MTDRTPYYIILQNNGNYAPVFMRLEFVEEARSS